MFFIFYVIIASLSFLSNRVNLEFHHLFCLYMHTKCSMQCRNENFCFIICIFRKTFILLCNVPEISERLHISTTPEEVNVKTVVKVTFLSLAVWYALLCFYGYYQIGLWILGWLCRGNFQMWHVSTGGDECRNCSKGNFSLYYVICSA